MPADFDPPCSFYIAPSSTLDSEDFSGTGSAANFPPSVQELTKQLESTNDQSKLKGMKELLLWIHSGSAEIQQSYDRLFMTVIRFVAPSKNHEVRKLVQLYWEVIPQLNEDGTMRQEMLLVSNFIRNDLQHPNEYVRGASLRSLAKMGSIQLLNTVVDCFPENLTHSSPYVRRNAAMCMFSFAQRLNYTMPSLINELEMMAVNEVDVATQRAAIMALIEYDPIRASKLFLLEDEKMAHVGESCLLTILSLIKVVHKLMFETFPPNGTSIELRNIVTKERLINILIDMQDSLSDVIVFEASSTLLWICDLAPGPTKQCCKALVKILLSQKDINIRLAILDKILTITKYCPGVFDAYVVDVLRILSSPSAEIRQKVLRCTLPSISARSVQDSLTAIKNQLVKSLESANESSSKIEVQTQLVQAMRYISSKFPEMADSVIELLLDLLSESDPRASIQVALLVREFVVSISTLRPKILSRLTEALSEIRDSRTLRLCLWVLGELCDSVTLRRDFVQAAFEALSPMPFGQPEDDAHGGLVEPSADSTGGAPESKVLTVRTIILPDGAYGTENIYDSTAMEGEEGDANKNVTGLRSNMVVKMDCLLATTLAVALSKVVCRELEKPLEAGEKNMTLMILGSSLKLFKDNSMFGVESSTFRRILQCLRAIVNSDRGKIVFHRRKSEELSKILEMERDTNWQEELGPSLERCGFNLLDDDMSEELTGNEVDDVLNFRTISGVERLTIPDSAGGGSGLSSAQKINKYLDSNTSLELAIKGSRGLGETSSFLMSLIRPERAKPLSGYSDPVYVECVVQVSHQDLIIEFLVVNQTEETLQNIAVILHTDGSPKILERPQMVTLCAGEEATVFATLRLTSAANGIVYGYCSYERKSAIDKEYFTLAEIQTDLLDCIERSYIGDEAFRNIWASLEWENPLRLDIRGGDLYEFLSRLLKQTKMTIVGLTDHPTSTREQALPRNHKRREEDFFKVQDDDEVATERYIAMIKQSSTLAAMSKSSFFALNFCLRSIFGEDALVNMSFERTADEDSAGGSGALSGVVRIRSRTQGIALTLGDAIVAMQRAQTTIDVIC